jgi:hypothetical protein
MNLVYGKTATRTADIDESSLILRDKDRRRLQEDNAWILTAVSQRPKTRVVVVGQDCIPLQGSRAKYNGSPSPEAVAATLNRFMGTGISLCRRILM